MKNVLLFSLMTLGFQAFADDVDYSYCRDAFEFKGAGFGGAYSEKGFPFTITNDGKVKAHDLVKSFKTDEKENIDIIELGEEPYKTKIVIAKNDKGEITQVIQSTTYDAPEVKSGVGAKRKNVGYPGVGMGMMGMGYPAGGMGGFGMPMQDMVNSTITDVKIQNGKCFPYRSFLETKIGKSTEKHFTTDVQLCKDIKDFFKANPQASSCFDPKLNAEMDKVFGGHKSRNSDVYKPLKSKKSDKTTKSNYSYYEDAEDFTGEEYSGGGFGNYGGYGVGAVGGFGMFIDTMIPEKGQFNPNGSSIITGHLMSQYCAFPGSAVENMIKDDQLFKSISIPNDSIVAPTIKK
jgi:hypothetical protein